MGRRFIIPQFELVEPLFGSDHYILIADYNFYVKFENEIMEWANVCTPSLTRKGMVLAFDSHAEVTNFLLRWS